MLTDSQAASVVALRIKWVKWVNWIDGIDGIDRNGRMRTSERSKIRGVEILLVLLFTACSVAWSQGRPDFSGLWKQDNERCEPKRNGNVLLRIEHHDPTFIAETTMARDSAHSRHAIQKYTTDGKVSVSIGTDGDEFHTSAIWKDSSLVFSIEEHEDGRILRSQETWTLIENGTVLQRVREPRDKGERQTLIYVLQKPSSSIQSISPIAPGRTERRAAFFDANGPLTHGRPPIPPLRELRRTKYKLSRSMRTETECDDLRNALWASQPDQLLALDVREVKTI